MNMNCREMKSEMEEAVFSSLPLKENVRQHVAGCEKCATELAELQATWRLLDSWQAPEPSAFFDAKLYARLRSEQEATPASLWERAKAWVMYSSNLRMRQIAAGAMATVLVATGGTVALLNNGPVAVAQTSATVRDLQSYDGNAQVFQQLNALDGDEDSATGASN
jgi:anti-sigma factor RsiW